MAGGTGWAWGNDGLQCNCNPGWEAVATQRGLTVGSPCQLFSPQVWVIWFIHSIILEWSWGVLSLWGTWGQGLPSSPGTHHGDALAVSRQAKCWHCVTEVSVTWPTQQVFKCGCARKKPDQRRAGGWAKAEVKEQGEGHRQGELGPEQGGRAGLWWNSRCFSFAS